MNTIGSSVKEWKVISISALGTAIVLLILMVINHYAPFGTNSFAQADANIQYLDFFSYLKHLSQGDGSWTFSFDRGIGGNVWAVLTYYLFSPWNLLVIFFSQENLHSFYDILVVIKFSLSAMTMSFYLNRRFERRLASHIIIALGMCFGMMQYNLEQARNVMWLDGVYLLPLILWGVYQIREGKSILYFVIPSALAVICNWYTGLIDLLFAGFWTILEAALMKIESQTSWQAIIRFFLTTMIGIVLAVGIAAIIFVPTYVELSNGRASSLDWKLFHLSWQGSTGAILKGMTWGTFSSNGHVSLFAGSLVLIGALGIVFQKGVPRKQRYLLLILLLFFIAIFYWNPFFLLFSLLKDARSYWYRYSYVVIFSLIWMAGVFFSRSNRTVPRFLLIIPIIWLFAQFFHPYNTWRDVIASSTIFFLLLCSLRMEMQFFLRYKAYILLLLVIIDLSGNANHIMRHYDNYRFVGTYHNYVLDENRQIDSILSADSSFYRITQTKTFSSYVKDIKEHIIANYNEGMAYLYPTVASYTSSPVNNHLSFLNNIGYRKNGDNMNIVNTSLLGADSLLGVRYVLSDFHIPGLILDESKISANQKDVYQNPFAMPIAFRISEKVSMLHKYTDNPFVFTNDLYQDIFQENISVYVPVDHQLEGSDGIKKVRFAACSDRDGAVYGNFPFHDKDRNALIKLDDAYLQRYACWLSPSAIFVPMINGKGAVQWESQQDAADCIKAAQFYQVDEEALKAASSKAWQNAADIDKISDTDLRITVDALPDEKLFTSIPAHKGWHVMRNGKTIHPEALDNCLMIIPLEPGHNEILLSFELPGWKIGLICTAISLIICFLIERRRKIGRL